MKWIDFYIKKEHRIEMLRAIMGIALIWFSYLTGIGGIF